MPGWVFCAVSGGGGTGVVLASNARSTWSMARTYFRF